MPRHIEPPKVARGYAMYIDGKMLSVTIYLFLLFSMCNDASAVK